MNVLICGANGFIGRTIGDAFERAGHRVLRGVRHPVAAGEIGIDFTRDLDVDTWRARLSGIDVVVNAVGILIERNGQTFDSIHRRAPVALFDACRLAGVGRVVQVSALGADSGDTRYFRSKRAADEHLRGSNLSYQIVRPALVYGQGGASSGLFRTLASLPLHLLPAGGRQRLRPVHIDDVAQIVVRLASNDVQDRQTVDVVGATDVDYRGMLDTYRASMGLPPASHIGIPAWMIDAAAMLLDRVPGSTLTRDTWRMLRSGNSASAAATSALLGRSPAGIETFIGRAEAISARYEAAAIWRSLLLRGALAATWLWTAIVSALLYPRSASLALLSRAHLHGAMAVALLYGAALLDGVFGVATLVRPGKGLWAAQALTIAGYTLVICATMPDLLLHPFGPVLKNIPIFAALFILFAEDPRP